jgi:hypothetical protein
MNEREDRQYVLGEDVTDLATPEELSGTGLLAVELLVEELEALESMGERQGKSAVEVARTAINFYIWINPTTITLSSDSYAPNVMTGGQSKVSIARIPA